VENALPKLKNLLEVAAVYAVIIKHKMKWLLIGIVRHKEASSSMGCFK
jgi:hypothetical protein